MQGTGEGAACREQGEAQKPCQEGKPLPSAQRPCPRPQVRGISPSVACFAADWLINTENIRVASIITQVAEAAALHCVEALPWPVACFVSADALGVVHKSPAPLQETASNVCLVCLNIARSHCKDDALLKSISMMVIAP